MTEPTYVVLRVPEGTVDPLKHVQQSLKDARCPECVGFADSAHLLTLKELRPPLVRECCCDGKQSMKDRCVSSCSPKCAFWFGHISRVDGILATLAEKLEAPKK